MLKNKYLVGAFKAFCFFIVFVMVFHIATYVLMGKGDVNLLRPFYREKRNTYEVVFLGSSRTRSISPYDLYGDYGIVGYNLSSSAQSQPMSYAILKEAIRLQGDSLKLVVYDTHFVHKPEGYQEELYAYYHWVLDNMDAFHPNRYIAINKTIPDNLKLEFYFTITKYHTRWNQLNESDFQRAGNDRLGGMVLHLDKQEELPDFLIIPQDKVTYPPGIDELQEIIDLCKENNLELLLICLPDQSAYAEQFQEYANYVQITADENDLNYVNFYHLINEVGLDANTDYADIGQHLNQYGVEKVSKYLFEYINNHYTLTDYRNDPKYKHIESGYQNYLSEYGPYSIKYAPNTFDDEDEESE